MTPIEPPIPGRWHRIAAALGFRVLGGALLALAFFAAVIVGYGSFHDAWHRLDVGPALVRAAALGAAAGLLYALARLAFPDPAASDPHPFARIRVRGLLLWLFLGMVLALVLAEAWPELGLPPIGEATRDNLLGYALYAWLGLWAWRLLRRHGLRLQDLDAGDRTDLPVGRTLAMVAALVAFSWGALWLLYYPLSFYWPGFVQEYLLDTPSFFFGPESTDRPAVHNVLSILVITLVAPVIEELLFRGIILHRWTYRWGPRRGVLLTSALFALGHPDVLGSFVFSVAMCLVYLRTCSLRLPIACHMLNNAAVVAVSFADASGEGYGNAYDVADFQADLGFGLICLAVSLPAVLWWLWRHWPPRGDLPCLTDDRPAAQYNPPEGQSG